MQKAVDPGEYAAAPWYEKRIFDGGERLTKVGDSVQLSPYAGRFENSLIVAVISAVIAVLMGTITAYGFSRFKIAGEGALLFFILSSRMLTPGALALSEHSQ